MTTTAEHIAAIRDALAEPEIARFPDFTKAVSAMADEFDRLKVQNERMRQALEPFALIASEGVAKQTTGHVGITTSAEYFHAADAALKGDTHGN